MVCFRPRDLGDPQITGVDFVRSVDYTADILAAVVWIDSAPCCGFYCAMFNAFKSQLKPFFASGVHL